MCQGVVNYVEGDFFFGVIQVCVGVDGWVVQVYVYVVGCVGYERYFLVLYGVVEGDVGVGLVGGVLGDGGLGYGMFLQGK